MRGSITKRGDSYLVRVFKGRDSNGRQKYHVRTIHGTKKDADAYLTQVLQEMNQGTWTEPSMISLGEFLDRWLKDGDQTTTNNREFNAWAVEHYIKPKLDAIPLRRLSPMDIQGLYNSLRDRDLAAGTIRRIHAILASALECARLWRMIALNPARDVRLPKLENSEMLVLLPEECRRFLDVAHSERYFALWSFALETGMRPGEYLALRWEDLDLDSGAAMVQRSLARSKAKYERKGPKTQKSRRKVTLSPGLVQLLKTHKGLQAAERLEAGSKWVDLGLVFTATNGLPITRRNLIRRHFKPILKAASLPDIRLYDLRHTMATLLLIQGVNPKIVSERLGHASIRLTLDTYSHVLPDMQEEATKSLQSILYDRSEAKWLPPGGTNAPDKVKVRPRSA